MLIVSNIDVFYIKAFECSKKRWRKAEVEVSVSKHPKISSIFSASSTPLSTADQFPSKPFESSSTAEDVGTHHVDDVISASAHTETTEAPTPTTSACIDVPPDESILMDDLLTEQFIKSIRRVQHSSIRWKPILLCGLLARKWCSIGCELVQSYVGTEMEYIQILQGKESQTSKLLIQFHCTLSRYIFKIHKVILLRELFSTISASGNSSRLATTGFDSWDHIGRLNDHERSLQHRESLSKYAIRLAN